jgi:hypothetical protein
MAYINVHIDLGDIYDDLSKKEKEMLVDWLEQDDVLPTVAVSSYNGIMNQDFNDVCSKLAQSYYRMGKEDEETILKIMKKYN